MRITLCNALYPTPEAPATVGGAEVFVRQLAEGLVAAGDEVIAIRAALDGKARCETVNGVTVHFLPIRNLFPPFQEKRNPLLRLAWHIIDDWGRAPAALGAILADFRPDVFHSHTLNGLSSDAWRVARRLKASVLHTLHDYYLICPRCSRYHEGRVCGLSCRALTTRRRARAGSIDAVTSVSRRTLDIHCDEGVFGRDTPTHVVRNVANPALGPAGPLAHEGVLKVGYIGRFAEEKGVHVLIEAMSRLLPGVAELRLAGRVSPEEERRLRALAPQVKMDFLGFVAPMDFYESVHLTVVPSLWEEPGALVVQDSQAAGRPILGTRLGGTPECVEDGVTGWIVEPTADALAARLSLLAHEPQHVADAAAALATRQVGRRAFADLVADYRRIYASLARSAA